MLGQLVRSRADFSTAPCEVAASMSDANCGPRAVRADTTASYTAAVSTSELVPLSMIEFETSVFACEAGGGLTSITLPSPTCTPLRLVLYQRSSKTSTLIASPL